MIQYSSVIFAWTQPKMLWLVCADIYSVGPVYINGSKRVHHVNCVPYAKQQLAKKKSFHCTVVAARINRILERKYHHDRLVNVSNLNHSPVFKDSVSVIPVSVCRLALALSHSDFSHRHSILVINEQRVSNKFCVEKKNGWSFLSEKGSFIIHVSDSLKFHSTKVYTENSREKLFVARKLYDSDNRK